MRIAFDLDGTLIPCEHPFPTEPVPRGIVRRWFCSEPIRAGTVELLRSLDSLGHEVWIYTTSFRKSLPTRLLFWGYGARVRRVVNGDAHARQIRRLGPSYAFLSKYPPAFGIDLLVDDCEGVYQASREYGFEMVLLRQDDADWVNTVLRGAGVR